MRLHFVRHGEAEPEGGDPGLTPPGRQMCREAGQQLALRGARPGLALAAPSMRTLVSAEEVLAGLDRDLPIDSGTPLPRTRDELVALVGALEDSHPGLAEVVMVGHDITQRVLQQMLGSRVAAVPRHHRAVVLSLELRADGDMDGGEAWCWPGRPTG